jgi:hypothetical protein
VQLRRFRCLGFDWSLLADDRDLLDRVTYLYESCVLGDAGSSRHLFTLRSRKGSYAPCVSLYRDARVIAHRMLPSLAIERLVWEVNRGVVEDAGNQLLLHAAAAEADGRIALLAGPEGSGKSTMVTALVRAGLRYVTDETVAVKVPGSAIIPYPKPISLDVDSPAIAALPTSDPSPSLDGLGQRLVPAQSIRPNAVSSGGIPRLLVLLTGRHGRASSVECITRAEAAVALIEQAFNFRGLGPGRMETIAQIVRTSKCCRLDAGDLDANTQDILKLFSDAM